MREIVRQRIFKKYGQLCIHCGSSNNIEIDHIIPLSKGGEHSEFNFQPLCRKSNRKKRNSVDYDIFFKTKESTDYILISKEMCPILKGLKPSEFVAICVHYFKKQAEHYAGMD